MSGKKSEVFNSLFNSSPLNENLRHKSVRGAFFMATAGGIEFAVRLVSTLILARILAPEDFGLVAMVMALTGLVDIVKGLGLGSATVQRRDITHREISSLFWINVSAGGVLAFAFVAISPVISWFYGDGRLTAITLPLASTLLWGAMAVQHEALLNRQLKQGSLAFIRLFATVLSSCLGIAFALVGLGYWALVVREVARSLINLLGVWWFCRWMPALLFRPKEVRGFLNFGKDLTITILVVSIIEKIDGILVGRFFGPVALGVYRQAQNLTFTPVEQLNGPVSSIAQSGLSSLQSDPDRYRRYYQRVVGFVALVTMPLGVFAVVYHEEITLLVLGDKWLSAAPFLGVFAVAVAIRPTIATTAIILVTLGRSKVMLGLALAHSLVLILLLAAGLPWGPLGIAVAHVATSVVTIPLKLYYSFRGSPVTLGSFWSAIWMSLVSSVFMGVSLFVLCLTFPIAHSLPSLLVGCAIGATTYLLPWLLFPSGRAELWLILQDVQNAMLRRPIPPETTLAGKPRESHAPS
jgi:O-antigen/teichoic acid export membrane protein